MFGVVPKVLWDRVSPPDEQNRIPLATRTLLAVSDDGRHVVLVDTGCGTKWAPDKAARFAICYDVEAIPNALAAAGKSVEDVTDVVITHLHFDHNGGLTVWDGDDSNKTRLRYPHARHWIHEQHLRHARSPHLKDRASFIAPDFEALATAEKLELVRGDEPDRPLDGMSWLVSHGHTPYQLHPTFGEAQDQLLFVGDILPTSAHLSPPWVMAYDVAPITTIEEKLHVYTRCLEQGLTLAFPHDPKIGCARISGTAQKPRLEPVDHK